MRRQRDRAKRFWTGPFLTTLKRQWCQRRVKGLRLRVRSRNEEGSSDEERTAYSKLVSSLMQDKGEPQHGSAQKEAC